MDEMTIEKLAENYFSFMVNHMHAQSPNKTFHDYVNSNPNLPDITTERQEETIFNNHQDFGILDNYLKKLSLRLQRPDNFLDFERFVPQMRPRLKLELNKAPGSGHQIYLPSPVDFLFQGKFMNKVPELLAKRVFYLQIARKLLISSEGLSEEKSDDKKIHLISNNPQFSVKVNNAYGFITNSNPRANAQIEFVNKYLKDYYG